MRYVGLNFEKDFLKYNKLIYSKMVCTHWNSSKFRASTKSVEKCRTQIINLIKPSYIRSREYYNDDN
ncbi:hypothetical protein QTP88_020187 [Uroleucon formosanum]